jgi:hypothetical protein
MLARPRGFCRYIFGYDIPVRSGDSTAFPSVRRTVAWRFSGRGERPLNKGSRHSPNRLSCPIADLEIREG